ncbi:MAG: hypothetical protein PHC51_02680 [bacterium]|nr:hypothetical protein [bacterium]
MGKEDLTKDDVASLLDAVEKQLNEKDDSYLHAMLALDRVFTMPGAQNLLDASSRAKARELWDKIKSRGVHLSDPPIIFG